MAAWPTADALREALPHASHSLSNFPLLNAGRLLTREDMYTVVATATSVARHELINSSLCFEILATIATFLRSEPSDTVALATLSEVVDRVDFKSWVNTGVHVPLGRRLPSLKVYHTAYCSTALFASVHPDAQLALAAHATLLAIGADANRTSLFGEFINVYSSVQFCVLRGDAAAVRHLIALCDVSRDASSQPATPALRRVHQWVTARHGRAAIEVGTTAWWQSNFIEPVWQWSLMNEGFVMGSLAHLLFAVVAAPLSSFGARSSSQALQRHAAHSDVGFEALAAALRLTGSVHPPPPGAPVAAVEATASLTSGLSPLAVLLRDVVIISEPYFVRFVTTCPGVRWAAMGAPAAASSADVYAVFPAAGENSRLRAVEALLPRPGKPSVVQLSAVLAEGDAAVRFEVGSTLPSESLISRALARLPTPRLLASFPQEQRRRDTVAVGRASRLLHRVVQIVKAATAAAVAATPSLKHGLAYAAAHTVLLTPDADTISTATTTSVTTSASVTPHSSATSSIPHLQPLLEYEVGLLRERLLPAAELVITTSLPVERWKRLFSPALERAAHGALPAALRDALLTWVTLATGGAAPWAAPRSPVPPPAPSSVAGAAARSLWGAILSYRARRPIADNFFFSHGSPSALLFAVEVLSGTWRAEDVGLASAAIAMSVLVLATLDLPLLALRVVEEGLALEPLASPQLLSRMFEWGAALTPPAQLLIPLFVAVRRGNVVLTGLLAEAAAGDEGGSAATRAAILALPALAIASEPPVPATKCEGLEDCINLAGQALPILHRLVLLRSRQLARQRDRTSSPSDVSSNELFTLAAATFNHAGSVALIILRPTVFIGGVGGGSGSSGGKVANRSATQSPACIAGVVAAALFTYKPSARAPLLIPYFGEDVMPAVPLTFSDHSTLLAQFARSVGAVVGGYRVAALCSTTASGITVYASHIMPLSARRNDLARVVLLACLLRMEDVPELPFIPPMRMHLRSALETLLPKPIAMLASLAVESPGYYAVQVEAWSSVARAVLPDRARVRAGIAALTGEATAAPSASDAFPLGAVRALLAHRVPPAMAALLKASPSTSFSSLLSWLLGCLLLGVVDDAGATSLVRAVVAAAGSPLRDLPAANAMLLPIMAFAGVDAALAHTATRLEKAVRTAATEACQRVLVPLLVDELPCSAGRWRAAATPPSLPRRRRCEMPRVPTYAPCRSGWCCRTCCFQWARPGTRFSTPTPNATLRASSRCPSGSG